MNPRRSKLYGKEIAMATSASEGRILVLLPPPYGHGANPCWFVPYGEL